MIRVVQFADLVNRHDFIDSIVQRANPKHFQVGLCTRTRHSNIAEPVYGPQIPRWVIGGLGRWNIPRAAWQLAGLLRAWRANILHTHHYDQAVIGWLATRLYPKARLVIGRHYSDAIYRSSSGTKRKLLLAVERQCNQAAVRIVVPSTMIWEILADRQRIDSRKLALVPYGFVPDKYEAPSAAETESVRRQWKLDGTFVLGTFGRLAEEKGHRYLLEAFRALRDPLRGVALLIVGEGPERSALEQQVRISGLEDRVRFLGWRQDAMKIMAAVDGVVQPTLQEAFSQVMAEALWMRKPLIITDVSGAVDVVEDGANGLLVKKADPASLAQAIERLATDPTLRTRLGMAGRAYVESHLTVHHTIPMYERVYEEALEN